MSIMQFRFRIVLLSASMSFSIAAIAKIPRQKPVPPVESNGVRYSAEDAEYVAATDISTGNQLWRVRVFHTHINPWVEPDVQIVFIKELKLVNDSVYARDGKARCYRIDIKDHRVRKAPCSNAFPEHEDLKQ